MFCCHLTPFWTRASYFWGLLREAGLSRVIWKSLMRENQKSTFHNLLGFWVWLKKPYPDLLLWTGTWAVKICFNNSYLVGLPSSAIFGIGMSWDSPGGWGCRSCALTWAPAWAPGWHTTADTTGQTTRSVEADLFNIWWENSVLSTAVASYQGKAKQHP